MEQTFRNTEVLGSVSASAAEHGCAEVSTGLRVVSGTLLQLQWQRGPSCMILSGCAQPFQV